MANIRRFYSHSSESPAAISAAIFSKTSRCVWSRHAFVFFHQFCSSLAAFSASVFALHSRVEQILLPVMMMSMYTMPQELFTQCPFNLRWRTGACHAIDGSLTKKNQVFLDRSVFEKRRILEKTRKRIMV